jgi:hypothetical protein
MTEDTNANPNPYDPNDGQITFFGQANFRSAEHRFGIKREDRRRHMYVIGKTGMGKSTMLENMIIQDIQNGEGVAVVDPHGDLVEKVIDYVPPHRINDVVYINPADLDHPIAFNILENVGPEYRSLVSNGLVGVFKKIWADSWGPRLEYILINTILALLEYPGATLLGVMRVLVDTSYRRKVVRKITDPVVRSFWINEFNNYSEKFRNEAIAPIQNKIGQFLSSSLIRNMVGQVESAVNMRELMDDGKIVMMNLSKGRIGEENSALLGAMIITKIQLAAMSRVDIPEDTRRDFYLYVDEFQNFSTDSFAGILSEARKYHLNIIMAHQYIEQLTDEVRAAVFGNVGTLASFRVGATDAEELEKEFMPTFEQADIVTLPAYQIYLRLMIDGVASEPFSANTLPPISEAIGIREQVIDQSRERFAGDRLEVEEQILRWSGDEDSVPPAVKKMDAKKKDNKKKDSKTPEKKGGNAPVPQPPKPPQPPQAAASKEDDLAELRAKALSFVEDLAEENNKKAKKEKMDRIHAANKRKREEQKKGGNGSKKSSDRNNKRRNDNGRNDSRKNDNRRNDSRKDSQRDSDRNRGRDQDRKRRDRDDRPKKNTDKKKDTPPKKDEQKKEEPKRDNNRNEKRDEKRESPQKKDEKREPKKEHENRDADKEKKPKSSDNTQDQSQKEQKSSDSDAAPAKRKRRRKRKRSRSGNGGAKRREEDRPQKSDDQRPQQKNSEDQKKKKEPESKKDTSDNHQQPKKQNAQQPTQQQPKSKQMEPGKPVRFDE